MLDTVPLSAIALCYVPLAVTVIGLFAFFYLTDRDATRLYLRRLNPLPDAVRPENEPPDETITAEIPAGTVVTIIPADEADSTTSGSTTSTVKRIPPDQPAPQGGAKILDT